jgi:hypothetical protein
MGRKIKKLMMGLADNSDYGVGLIPSEREREFYFLIFILFSKFCKATRNTLNKR